MTRSLLLGVLGALALAGAVRAEAIQPNPERGRALAERWCANCHLLAPEGPGGDAGPSFPSLARTRSDEALRAWVSEPHPPMPDLDLSGRSVDDIAAYIRTLGQCEAAC